MHVVDGVLDQVNQDVLVTSTERLCDLLTGRTDVIWVRNPVSDVKTVRGVIEVTAAFSLKRRISIVFSWSPDALWRSLELLWWFWRW